MRHPLRANTYHLRSVSEAPALPCNTQHSAPTHPQHYLHIISGNARIIPIVVRSDATPMCDLHVYSELLIYVQETYHYHPHTL